MPRVRRTNRRLLAAAAPLAAVAALAGGVATAPPATAAGPTAVSVKAPSGSFLDRAGGWFDGLVYANPAASTPYQWKRGGESYTGPGGRTYHQYVHAGSGECLDHSGDHVVTEACNWWDNGQWWSAQLVITGAKPSPQPGVPPSMTYAHLLAAWDVPDKVMTESGTITLAPKAGPSGSAQQRFWVAPKPTG